MKQSAPQGQPATRRTDAAAIPKQTIIVSSTAGKTEIALETLVGEYVEMGSNHGKKVYKRTRGPQGLEDVQIFLYYWDTRDGADNSGWWFGASVGGEQVWSRHPRNTPLPPKLGWLVPWDGGVRNELVVELKRPAQPGAAAPAAAAGAAKAGAAAKAAAAPAAAAGAALQQQKAAAVKREQLQQNGGKGAPEPRGPAAAGLEAKGDRELKGPSAATLEALEERVEQATSQVEGLEGDVTQAIESVQTMMEGGLMDNPQDLLQKQQKAIGDFQKSLVVDLTKSKQFPKAFAALNKLMARARTLQASVMKEITDSKLVVQKKMAEADEAKKQEEEQEKRHEAEQRDTKKFEEMLLAAMEAVAGAEDLVRRVLVDAENAGVISTDEVNDAMLSAVRKTEGAASKAKAAIQQARSQIAIKITTAKAYVAEISKVALAEYATLQDKLGELEKKLAPYASVRRDYEKKMVASKVMSEVADKVGQVEGEVDKVMGEYKGEVELSEAGIKEAKTAISNVLLNVVGMVKFVEQRAATAQGVLKTDLEQMLERAKDSKGKLNGLLAELHSRREQMLLKTMLQQGEEKAQRAEELFEKTTEAEGPFLVGYDILPDGEGTRAIAACEAAAKEAEGAAQVAQRFLKAKLFEMKRLSEESKKPHVDAMAQLESRVEAVVKKVADFKLETAERKTAIALQAVTQVVGEAEAKVRSVVEAARPLTQDTLEDMSVDELRDATEATREAEKGASSACAAARQAVAVKQSDREVRNSHQQLGELSKLMGRVNTATQELSRQQKATAQGEAILRGKKLFQESEAELKPLEAEVERIVTLSNTVAGEDGEEPAEEALAELEAAVASAQTPIVKAISSLKSAQAAAHGPAKDQLGTLLSRARRASDKFHDAKAATREPREKALCKRAVKELQAMFEKLDAAFEQVATAEAPYLKGIEILPGEEAAEALKEADAAIAAVAQALGDARPLLAAKMQEIRSCAEAVQKAGLQEIGPFSERLEGDAEKLVEFKRETQGRRRVAVQQEAAAKVSAAEEAVKAVTREAAPLAAESINDLPQEEVLALCTKVTEADTAAQALIDSARQLVPKASFEPGARAGHLAHLQAAQKELEKARATTQERQQHLAAKMLLDEAQELAKDFDTETDSAAESVASLLKDGTHFMVASMIVEALKDHCDRKDVSKEALFKECKPADDSEDGGCKEAEFRAFLEKVPALCDNPKLVVPAEQVPSVFKQVDADKDGVVSEAEFLAMFGERFFWMHEGLEKTLGAVQASGAKASAFAVQKTNELRDATQGPLKDAKGELTTVRRQINTTQVKLDRLKKDIEESKKEYGKAEAAHRKELQERREKAEALSIVSALCEKVDAACAAVQQLEEAAAPLTSLPEADFAAVPTPSSLWSTADAAAASAASSVASARDGIKAQEGRVAKATTGCWFEAKQEMEKLQARVQGADKSVCGLRANIQSAYDGIAEAIKHKATDAIQKSLQAGQITLEKLYAELAGENADFASEAGFFAHLSKHNCELTQEQREVFLPADDAAKGISRRTFFQMFERFCVCKKNIAITTEFDVEVSASKRLLQKDEFVEVLEGPRRDEKLGVGRVRIRALSDQEEGWVTVRGNHNTQYLADVKRPNYIIMKPVAMQDALLSEGSSDLRMLKVDEVIEVIEGPRKEETGNATRAKGKCDDGTAGWFSVKSRGGQEMAKPHQCEYTCLSSIALTDGANIKECKVLRKLERGEVLTALEGPVKDDEAGVTRIKARAVKDGAEGWVTAKGNAGTMYAQETRRKYVVVQATALQADAASGSATLRLLEKDEAIELIEAPREERSAPVLRVRGRAVLDGTVGWFTVDSSSLRRWSPVYRCVTRTVVHDRLSMEGAETLRHIEVDELIELLEGPREETEVGVLRLKGRAEKDGTIGWVTIAGNQGKRFLECIPMALLSSVWRRSTPHRASGSSGDADTSLPKKVSFPGAAADGGDQKPVDGAMETSRKRFWEAMAELPPEVDSDPTCQRRLAELIGRAAEATHAQSVDALVDQVREIRPNS